VKEKEEETRQSRDLNVECVHSSDGQISNLESNHTWLA